MAIKSDNTPSYLGPPVYPSVEPTSESGMNTQENRSKVATKFVSDLLSIAISNVSSKKIMPPIPPITDHQVLKRGHHILGNTLSMIEAALSNKNPQEYRDDLLEIKRQLYEWGHQFLHNLPVLASEHDATAQLPSSNTPNIACVYSSQSILQTEALSIINNLLPLLDSSIGSSDEFTSRQILENARTTLAQSRNIFLDYSNPSFQLKTKNTSTGETSCAGAGIGNKASPLAKKYSVLLAEDVPSIAKVVIRILQQLGCDVHWCDNGEKALRELLNPQRVYHIAFLDIDMPILKGDAVVQRFKQEAKKATESGLNSCLKKYAVPCLALTANTEDADVYRTKGMIDVLAKPATKKELETAIATHAIFEEEDGS
jgi:CheY-like chemotaxis protein